MNSRVYEKMEYMKHLEDNIDKINNKKICICDREGIPIKKGNIY
jgi:hypothetical protein